MVGRIIDFRKKVKSVKNTGNKMAVGIKSLINNNKKSIFLHGFFKFLM